MQEKKVVVIGGGTGTDITLAGLKRYTSHLTALVSTFDASTRGRWQSGGNGDPSADEVRNSLLALGADASTTQIMQRLFAYQLTHSTERDSHTFGTLFLSALTEITGGADRALQAASRMLNVQGQVLPITLDPSPLIAHLNDGSETIVRTPSELIEASSGNGLWRISLAHSAPALAAALQTIESADIVVLGPADFHFNLLAPLQLEGVVEALAATKAVKIFVCNILTQPNITHGWPASRFIRTLLDNMGMSTTNRHKQGSGSFDGGPLHGHQGMEAGLLDFVIVNSSSFALDALGAKSARGRSLVRLDLEECLSLGLNVIVRPVASSETLYHDAEKLARTILFLGGWRSARRSEKQVLLDRTNEDEILQVDSSPSAHRKTEGAFSSFALGPSSS